MPNETRRGYTVRACRNIDELAACVRLQQQIWGYTEGEVYPLRLFVNLAHIGGHVIGAFARGSTSSHGGEMVGFVAAMPAWRDGRRYLHSLSLGVARGHENHGLGRRLKLEQRRLALEAGIRLIEWTFDPLRAKNAFLNLVRLGAITRRYAPDYYGRVESRLQQGLPSDRLVCEWWLHSAWVQAALRQQGVPRRRNEKRPQAEIVIPADFAALAERDHAEAVRQQRSVRRKFENCFRRGLVVTGFEPGQDFGYYRLETLHENKPY